MDNIDLLCDEEGILSSGSNSPVEPLFSALQALSGLVNEHDREAAALSFKGDITTRWLPSPGVFPVPDAEKAKIKKLIVPVLISATPRIKAQLIEALAVIADYDFPSRWEALLPELVPSLRTALDGDDFPKVNSVLAIVDLVFKKLRHPYKSDDSLSDLRYCLNCFAAPLLDAVESISLRINAADGNTATLRQLIEAQTLCCLAFYSLNYLNVQQFFKDTADRWMKEFTNYLTQGHPVNDADVVALVDDLQTAVCKIIIRCMEKEEELFRDYLPGFVEAVVNLLVASPSSEKLTVTAIKFLTIVSTSGRHDLVSGDARLDMITEGIVIPNVMVRDEDEQLFNTNYANFIRRDTEGRDRRRVVCELLKGIAGNYKEKITDRVSGQIKKLLTSCHGDPSADWKSKESAIYLVVSLATKEAADASISTDLVSVSEFLKSVIVPELRGQDVNAFPMLKAGALKFLIMFRVVIPKNTVLEHFSDVVRLIGSDANVVVSYAATCIEKFLLIMDDGVQPRYTSSDISRYQPLLIANLCGAMQKQPDQYVGSCLSRVLEIANLNSEDMGISKASLMEAVQSLLPPEKKRRVDSGDPLKRERLSHHRQPGPHVKDVLDRMHETEVEKNYERKPDYIENVQESISEEYRITAEYRGKVVQWLAELAGQFKFPLETLYLSVCFVDRFLSTQALDKSRLELLAAASLLLASKYEDRYHHATTGLLSKSEGYTYTQQQVVKMEMSLCKTLGYKLGNLTPKAFLRVYMLMAEDDSQMSNSQLEFLCDYLLELSLLEYECIKFSSSMLASAALFLARVTLNPLLCPWNSELKRISGYNALELEACVGVLQELQAKKRAVELSGVRTKYMESELGRVACYKPPTIPSDYFKVVEEGAA